MPCRRYAILFFFNFAGGNVDKANRNTAIAVVYSADVK